MRISMRAVFQVFLMGCIGYAFYKDSLMMAGLGILAELAALNWKSVHAFLAGIRELNFRGNNKGIQFSAKRDISVIELLAAPRVPKELKKLVFDAAETAQAPEPQQGLPGFIDSEEAIRRVAELQDIVVLLRDRKIVFLPSGPDAYALKGAENPSYQIQVAEDMGTHLATYDFVYVDAKSGEVIHREHNG